jgi:hypothetical protein
MIGCIGLEPNPIILQFHLMNARPDGREHSDVEKSLGIAFIRDHDIDGLGSGVGNKPKEGWLFEHGQTNMVRG